MSRHAISGFPEWLPDQRIVEAHVEDTLRETFELHGFQGLKTRSVEPLSALESKGETSKEVYLLRRLQGAREGVGGTVDGNTLGLHFDLTVPLARYVVANSSNLVFPFKRYQIQSVWRGERPQEGRFREFTQADVDIVGQNTLGTHHDVEVAEAMLLALGNLGIGPVLMEVNNRALMQGLLQAAGVEDFDGALRALDKLDKIGEDGVAEELGALGLSEERTGLILAIAKIEAASGEDLRAQVEALGLPLDDGARGGLDDLVEVLDSLNEVAPGEVQAALRIARGLDYYTGTVFETTLPGFESYGSICSGGRYDTLASAGNRVFPGVGLSVGVTRLAALILNAGLLAASRPSPSAVFVLVPSEEERSDANRVARVLRSRGIAAEVSPTSAKFGRQIRQANRKGIPYVWFLDGDEHSVKNLVDGTQVPADLETWQPDEGLARIRVAKPTA